MPKMKLFTNPLPQDKPRYTTVSVTPELARTWLIRYRYPRQRKIRDYRVGELEEMMRYGTFRAYSTLTFGRAEGSIFLLNGYHRLEGLCRYGKAVVFTIEERDEATLEALDELYDTFDREMMRSYMDLLRASDYADLHSITPTLMKVLHSAMPLLISGFTDSGNVKGSAVSKIMRDTRHMADFMTEWLDEAEQYMVALAGVDTVTQRMFHRAGVMSVALVTLRYVPEHASEFWHTACHMTGLADGDVELVLNKWLERNRPLANNRLDYSRSVASAWNGYVDEKGDLLQRERCRLTRRHIRHSFLLHGTPFKGTQDLWFIGDKGEPIGNPVPRRRQGYIRPDPDNPTAMDRDEAALADPTLCTRCGLAAREPHQRWCRQCLTDYKRDRDERQRMLV
jgi:hypothetical protein